MQQSIVKQVRRFHRIVLMFPLSIRAAGWKLENSLAIYDTGQSMGTERERERESTACAKPIASKDSPRKREVEIGICGSNRGNFQGKKFH